MCIRKQCKHCFDSGDQSGDNHNKNVKFEIDDTAVKSISVYKRHALNGTKLKKKETFK